MNEELVTIATFTTPTEAAVARVALETVGITAFVANDHLVGMAWVLSNALGNVKVFVPASEAERALAILKTSYADWPDEAGRTWTCPNCGEENQTKYDQCWACDAACPVDHSLPQHQAKSDAPPASENAEAGHPVRSDIPTTDNPYSAPAAAEHAAITSPRAYDAPSGDAIAGRAWRAAIFGLVVCWGFDWPLPMSHPLLGLAMTFYSVALLISLAVTNVPLSDRARWCNLGAWVFNALATLAIGSVVGVFAAIANG